MVLITPAPVGMIMMRCQSGYVLACKAMLGAFDSPAHLQAPVVRAIF